MQLTTVSRVRSLDSLVHHTLCAALLVLALCTPAPGQTLPPVSQTADLSGPRFGVTLLSDGIVGELRNKNLTVGPAVSQFGWQWEKQFFTRDSGVTMVSEWVALAGGLEQNVFLPSLSWLVGIRNSDGFEFGVGPNITPAGPALVFAAGMTFQAGPMNVPVNVAVVPSKMGTRVSVLTGFSLRREPGYSRRPRAWAPPRRPAWGGVPPPYPPPIPGSCSLRNGCRAR